MKKLLFTVAFLISFISSSQFIPLLDENNSWSVDLYFAPFDPPDPPYNWTETVQITVGNIVVINNLDYHRIMSGDQETCLLREENGIVYKYDVNNSIDRILFDFNLNVGDTFDLYGSAYDDYMYCILVGSTILEPQLTVESVEVIQIAGVMRKVITFTAFTNYGQLQWIEGIGNISGFDLLWEALDITDGSLLVCFETNGINYFFNGATSCDNTTLGIDDLSEENIILYPNPVSNKSILQFPADNSIDLIRIIDITGKLIKEEPIKKDYFLINASEYASGLYFYQVFSESHLAKTEKFIVK